MANDKVQLFEDQPIRTAWVEDEEEWYFSVVDVVRVLTEQPDTDGARNYWKVLKNRIKEEGNELVTNCNQLKMKAQDGKMRFTDVANTEQLLRSKSNRKPLRKVEWSQLKAEKLLGKQGSPLKSVPASRLSRVKMLHNCMI